MRVGFKVDRIGYYRLYGPLIEEALRQGAEVFLLHRDRASDRVGEKAYQWADPAAVPSFAHGSPHVLQWRSDGDLHEAALRAALDALVTIWWIDAAPCTALRDRGVTWVALQESYEFPSYPLETVLLSDVTCMFSEWWVELAERYFSDAPPGLLHQRLVAVGWPELDAFRLVIPDEVRTRYGIGRSAPVVTLASYKYHADDAWEQIVFRSSSPLGAAVAALARLRPDMLRFLADGVTYPAFVRSLRAFCDLNGAVLISKSRGKDRPPALERELADIALGDSSHHPATIVEVAAITDVFIGFLSTATLEAVYGGAYVLCPLPPEHSTWLRTRDATRALHLMGYRGPGSIWNFPGVVEQVAVADLIRELPGMSLARLRSDPTARARYVEQFLGGTDPPHAARAWRQLVDVVERKQSAWRSRSRSL